MRMGPRFRGDDIEDQNGSPLSRGTTSRIKMGPRFRGGRHRGSKWVPAFAGDDIEDQNGSPLSRGRHRGSEWVPAFAGTTSRIRMGPRFRGDDGSCLGMVDPVIPAKA